jgi:hypothetical protein
MAKFAPSAKRIVRSESPLPAMLEVVREGPGV